MAVWLLGSGAWVHGQMLGTPVADLLMGRPLDMTLPARFATADTGDECVQADVFYGETRVKAGDVRATITGPAEQRRIRVESAAPIDEPIVTVSVRAGCRNTVTRNYTLLPEYPSERLIAAADARRAMAGAVPAIPLKMAAAPAPAIAPRKPAPRPLVLARADAPAAAVAPAPARTPARHASPLRKETVRGARLSLEPLEMPEPQAMLRVSNVLAEPAGDASRRAAAALLWQAINADPQEVLRTSMMIQKLEQDLAQLRQSSNQTRAEMAALRQRLDQPQPWYQATLLVQLLSVLLLAGAGAAGVFWYRTRHLADRRGLWYVPRVRPEEAPQREEVVAHEDPVAMPPVSERPAVAPTLPASLAVPPAVVAPVAAAGKEDDHAIDFEVAATIPAAARPAPRTDGVLRVETLAATLEEVDFLRSLGLRPDAMDILKSYLQDSSGPAPLAWLELMCLCEDAGDPAAVATVRRRYAQAYGVEAPRLAQITAEGGLDGMADLSARITRSWNNGDALQVIEEALFLVPTPAAPITLQAGRDLLALYDLALVRSAEGVVQGAEAPLAPWAHVEDAHAAQEAAKDAADADGGRHFALDVDLTSTAPLEAAASEFRLAPMLARAKDSAREKAAREQAAREEAARRAREEEEAFSAAVASERFPVSRY